MRHENKGGEGKAVGDWWLVVVRHDDKDGEGLAVDDCWLVDCG